MIVGLWLWPNVAPATIAEQRARLPPPAECGDEIVEGIWRSHAYMRRLGVWDIFTLVVRRDPNDRDALIGTITDHHWDGSPQDEQPPPCAQQTGMEWLVSTDARGRVTDGTHIVFHGVGQWRLDEVRCRRGTSAYNLDRFTGAIDPSILEFQSMNDDGGAYVDVPTVFRRVRCPPAPSAEAPSVNPTRPPFYPSRTGCGL